MASGRQTEAERALAAFTVDLYRNGGDDPPPDLLALIRVRENPHHPNAGRSDAAT
jgi:hypothetical protein